MRGRAPNGAAGLGGSLALPCVFGSGGMAVLFEQFAEVRAEEARFEFGEVRQGAGGPLDARRKIGRRVDEEHTLTANRAKSAAVTAERRMTHDNADFFGKLGQQGNLGNLCHLCVFKFSHGRDRYWKHSLPAWGIQLQ